MNKKFEIFWKNLSLLRNKDDSWKQIYVVFRFSEVLCRLCVYETFLKICYLKYFIFMKIWIKIKIFWKNLSLLRNKFILYFNLKEFIFFLCFSVNCVNCRMKCFPKCYVGYRLVYYLWYANCMPSSLPSHNPGTGQTKIMGTWRGAGGGATIIKQHYIKWCFFVFVF